MKKLFLSLVALIATTMSFAQSTLVATLSHGSNITMYYGTYALRDAYNAAVSGDIINLSGGSFQAVDIKKAVTLRGVGIDDVNPTYITNYFTIEIPSGDTKRMSMEGIRCANNITMKGTFSNAYFLKCQLWGVSFNSSSEAKNILFANCKITNGVGLNGNSTAQFVNSYTNGFTSTEASSATFVNCMINTGVTASSQIINTQLTNCILWHLGNGANSLPGSTITNNCIAVPKGNNGSLFYNSTTNHNSQLADFTDVFKNFTGSYSDSETFELTDAAKTKYLGNDGTEVGLYGGIMPYTSTPSYPQITKMKVANKTTADGKLSVEIEVSAAQ